MKAQRRPAKRAAKAGATRKKAVSATKAVSASKSGGGRKTANGKARTAANTPRPFWSGTVTFGLVTVPVELFSGIRERGVSLRMLSAEGTPLRQQYFDAGGEEPLTDEDIVRGYEHEGKMVVLEDEELAALEPRKSRDIELLRFVDVASIDPLLFERPYLLAPTSSSAKSYRLLAQVMSDQGKAAIATFVMRGKQHLVAIIADHGVLRIETLRFADEVRDPSSIGLGRKPASTPALKKRAEKYAGLIRKLTKSQISAADLEDGYRERFEKLVEKKKKVRTAIVKAPADAQIEHPEVINLVELLKKSMMAAGTGERSAPESRSSSSKPRARAKARATKAASA